MLRRQKEEQERRQREQQQHTPEVMSASSAGMECVKREQEEAREWKVQCAEVIPQLP